MYINRKACRSRRPVPWLLLGLVPLLAATLIWGLSSSITHADMAGGHHNENGDRGSYWSIPDRQFKMSFTAKTDSRPFHIGDIVTMPNNLQLQVTRIERNWQPAAPIAEAFGNSPLGDKPAGREVILVWFKGTDVGTEPIPYNDSSFTLQRAGQPDQRVATLATLPPGSYGSRDKMPWLQPGESMTTFVPFLITLGEAPTSFQYYYWTPKHDVASRLSILLKPGSQASSQYIFTPDQETTVR